MSVHTNEHVLTEAPMAVGVHNYCSDCRDRICLECRKTDCETTGGSWMSGLCFGCQWIVGERQDAERRQREIDEDNRRRADAWDEGWKSGALHDGTDDRPRNPYR